MSEAPAYEYDESRVSDLLPDRRDSDLPPQVQFFLSVVEAAMASHRYQAKHLDEPQTYFCEGVLDYWWQDNEELVEPRFEQLFRRPLREDGEWEGYPSHKRFCYQQGAILGYQLSEQYEDKGKA